MALDPVLYRRALERVEDIGGGDVEIGAVAGVAQPEIALGCDRHHLATDLQRRQRRSARRRLAAAAGGTHLYGGGAEAKPQSLRHQSRIECRAVGEQQRDTPHDAGGVLGRKRQSADAGGSFSERGQGNGGAGEGGDDAGRVGTGIGEAGLARRLGARRATGHGKAEHGRAGRQRLGEAGVAVRKPGHGVLQPRSERRIVTAHEIGQARWRGPVGLGEDDVEGDHGGAEIG